MKRPTLVLILAAITGLSLLVALGLILFSVNPGVDDNEKEIRQAQHALRAAQDAQHAITCAQVQTTANAYRFRSLTPSGAVEPIRHFLTRMQAQAQTLRLARGSECKSAPGFPPVGVQVRRALAQIKRIMEAYDAIEEKRIFFPRSVEEKQLSFSPSSMLPSNAGIGEEGVPATLGPSQGVTRDPEKPERQPKEPRPPRIPNPVVPPAPLPVPIPTPVQEPEKEPGAIGKLKAPGLVEGEIEVPIGKVIAEVSTVLEGE